MSEEFDGEITQLLKQWSAGKNSAFEALVGNVYSDLRAIARNALKRERQGHTFSPTALVHEAVLKLQQSSEIGKQFSDSGHFFKIVARLMRQILVSYARRYMANKRPEKLNREDLSHIDVANVQPRYITLLNEALQALGEVDQRKAQIVELRYFGGLSIDKTADILELSPATISREWKMARAFLRQHMTQ